MAHASHTLPQQLAHQQEGAAPKGDPPIHIHLLGTFRMAIGTQFVAEGAWRRRKAKTIIKLLGLAPNHRLRRDYVLDLLWPDLTLAAAANNLHVTLNTMRQSIAALGEPADLVRLDGDYLWLAPNVVWVDALAFERAASNARRARTVEAYTAALALYTGELLPEDLYADWSAARRTALHQLQIALLLELAELHTARDALAAAAAILTQALASEPALEEAHIALMRLYAAMGQRQQALRQYEQLATALQHELGSTPDAAAHQLYEEIQTGRFAEHPLWRGAQARLAAPQHSSHNMPIPLTSFIGRTRELVEIKNLLAVSRLLTLKGFGGCGKTRLATQLGADVVDHYRDGVWMVELGPLTEAAMVPQAVAAVLNVHEVAGQPLSVTLAEALRARQMLIILDNCEHQLDASAQLVTLLLHSCPHIQLLATSRAALRVSGEVIWNIPALSLPDQLSLPPEALLTFEAVRLFVARACTHQVLFALDEHNGRQVASICKRLDGIPLAIELAAARLTTLTVTQLLERLEDALRVLTRGSRSATPRHQTLRATLDWSYALLSTSEQTLLHRLAVFAGGWTLEAAESVCAGGDIRAATVLDLLAQLVDQSLVITELAGDAIRYTMLETIRAYGQERLAASDDSGDRVQAHALFYLHLAEQAEPELQAAQQTAWVKRLEREHDNLRAALRYTLVGTLAPLGLRLVGAVWRFWMIRDHLNEGRYWLDLALAQQQCVPIEVQTKVLLGAGRLARQQGDLSRATAHLEAALALQHGREDAQTLAALLGQLGVVAYDQADFARATALHEQSLALRRATGDTWGIAATLTNLGELARQRGDYARAVELQRESLGLFRALGEAYSTATALINLGVALHYLGHHAQAGAPLSEALTLYLTLENKDGVAECLEALALVASAQAQPLRAAQLAGAAEALRELIGCPLPPADQARYAPQLAAARAQVDASAFDAAWRAGRTMPLDQAVQVARKADVALLAGLEV